MQVLQNLERTKFVPSIQMQDVPRDLDRDDMDEDLEDPDVRATELAKDARIIPETELHEDDAMGQRSTEGKADTRVLNEESHDGHAPDPRTDPSKMEVIEEEEEEEVKIEGQRQHELSESAYEMVVEDQDSAATEPRLEQHGQDESEEKVTVKMEEEEKQNAEERTGLGSDQLQLSSSTVGQDTTEGKETQKQASPTTIDIEYADEPEQQMQTEKRSMLNTSPAANIATSIQTPQPSTGIATIGWGSALSSPPRGQHMVTDSKPAPPAEGNTTSAKPRLVSNGTHEQ
ncbi:hypothetical protein EV182_006102 [Spiromyces aspiralis]|uniref:Uncharacterized protein n=1 Tax=Spiromyces aspiralis TaxID=68401 RepID=A0ACC1H921_9FUNG|nr:hypothetical protein EV182_006102 [Spiromyces aspiralis]